MYEIKTEILQICEAFNLGTFISFESLAEKNGFIETEFKTFIGVYTHYFNAKKLK